MKFIEYIDSRCKGARSLTKAEAKVLKIHYPLVKGWVSQYSNMELSDNMLESLLRARDKRYKQKSYKKAKAKAQKKGKLSRSNDFKSATSKDIKILEDALKKLKAAQYKVDNGLSRSSNPDAYRVIQRDEYKILQEAKKHLE